MEGGDYIAETKRLLREAPMMAAKRQRFTDEIAELEALLADESIAAARNGVDAIGRFADGRGCGHRRHDTFGVCRQCADDEGIT